MLEGPAHSGQCHPQAGGQIRNQVSHGEQAHKQYSSDLCSGSCLQGPALLDFLPWLPSVLGCDTNTVSQIKSFLTKLLLVMIFITATEVRSTQEASTLWATPASSKLSQRTNPEDRNKYEKGNEFSKLLKRKYVKMNLLRFCEWRKEK